MILAGKAAFFPWFQLAGEGSLNWVLKEEGIAAKLVSNEAVNYYKVFGQAATYIDSSLF